MKKKNNFGTLSVSLLSIEFRSIKLKTFKRKFCLKKTNTTAIIDLSFVREQLYTCSRKFSGSDNYFLPTVLGNGLTSLPVSINNSIRFKKHSLLCPLGVLVVRTFSGPVFWTVANETVSPSPAPASTKSSHSSSATRSSTPWSSVKSTTAEATLLVTTA